MAISRTPHFSKEIQDTTITNLSRRMCKTSCPPASPGPAPFLAVAPVPVVFASSFVVVPCLLPIALRYKVEAVVTAPAGTRSFLRDSMARRELG